jgi:hypothetical protein
MRVGDRMKLAYVRTQNFKLRVYNCLLDKIANFEKSWIKKILVLLDIEIFLLQLVLMACSRSSYR